MTHNYLDNAKSFVNLPLYTTPMDMKSKNQAMTEVQIFLKYCINRTAMTV